MRARALPIRFFRRREDGARCVPQAPPQLETRVGATLTGNLPPNCSRPNVRRQADCGSDVPFLGSSIPTLVRKEAAGKAEQRIRQAQLKLNRIEAALLLAAAFS